MKKFIEKLHFITHDVAPHTHVEQAQLACEAGAKWIQYRCLTKGDNELLSDIEQISAICDDWGATLIVTDHLHLAGQADIQGFHVEDMDADFMALRHQIGDEYTLGGSANTIDGLLRLAEQAVDYAGFGPYATSLTKASSFPLLGLKGYNDAVKALNDAAIALPILAVSGIKLPDVAPLLQTGIYGIAISSAIGQAEDLYEAYQEFYQLVLDRS